MSANIRVFGVYWKDTISPFGFKKRSVGSGITGSKGEVIGEGLPMVHPL